MPDSASLLNFTSVSKAWPAAPGWLVPSSYTASSPWNLPVFAAEMYSESPANAIRIGQEETVRTERAEGASPVTHNFSKHAKYDWSESVGWLTAFKCSTHLAP
jgi:hypothetical protein